MPRGINKARIANMRTNASARKNRAEKNALARKVISTINKIEKNKK